MRVSIITPTNDHATFIDQAVRSVVPPDGVTVEHIIVHDGDDDFVNALVALHPHLRIMRGRERGPPDAVNMGFAAARGDFLFNLNSDDRLMPDALRVLRDHAIERPEVRVWTGGVRMFRMEDDREATLWEVADRSYTEPSWRNALDGLPLINTRFLHRAVRERLGEILKPRYTRCADRDTLVRIILSGVPEASLGTIVAEYRLHAGSLSMSDDPGLTAECLEQHLELADEWINDPTISKNVRRRFIGWRNREGLRATRYRVRALGGIRGFVHGVGRLTRHPTWLWSVPSAIAASRWRRRMS